MNRIAFMRAVSGRSGRRRGSQKPGTTAGDAWRSAALACATAGARSQISPARPRSTASAGASRRTAPDARTHAGKNESGIGFSIAGTFGEVPDSWFRHNCCGGTKSVRRTTRLIDTTRGVGKGGPELAAEHAAAETGATPSPGLRVALGESYRFGLLLAGTSCTI